MKSFIWNQDAEPPKHQVLPQISTTAPHTTHPPSHTIHPPHTLHPPSHTHTASTLTHTHCIHPHCIHPHTHCFHLHTHSVSTLKNITHPLSHTQCIHPQTMNPPSHTHYESTHSHTHCIKTYTHTLNPPSSWCTNLACCPPWLPARCWRWCSSCQRTQHGSWGGAAWRAARPGCSGSAGSDDWPGSCTASPRGAGTPGDLSHKHPHYATAPSAQQVVFNAQSTTTVILVQWPLTSNTAVVSGTDN